MATSVVLDKDVEKSLTQNLQRREIGGIVNYKKRSILHSNVSLARVRFMLIQYDK